MAWLVFAALVVVTILELVFCKYKREIWSSVIFPKDDE